jgi:hypothetical protein
MFVPSKIKIRPCQDEAAILAVRPAYRAPEGKTGGSGTMTCKRYRVTSHNGGSTVLNNNSNKKAAGLVAGGFFVQRQRRCGETN